MRFSTTAAAVLGIALGWVIAEAAGPPPVMKDMGQVHPTPAPTEKTFQRKRLITSLTVQNSPKGETVLTFEASDVAESKDGKFKPITSERFSLGDVKTENIAHRDEILRDLRQVEEALLKYVEAVGGVRERGRDKGGEKRPD